jgi:glucose-1-phosphatase
VKIEAILFDLGKVIIDFNFEAGLQALQAYCPSSREKLEDALWDKNWIRRYERGEISTADFHSHLCRSAGLRMELSKFCETWSSVFLPDLIVSEQLLATLKKRYPLILVSNTNEVHAEYIRSNYRIFDYFDHLIFSHEVGSLKPDTKIFKHAISKAGHSPERLFFIDDREENILAAANLGIRAHQFISESRLIEALREAGVETGN